MNLISGTCDRCDAEATGFNIRGRFCNTHKPLFVFNSRECSHDFTLRWVEDGTGRWTLLFVCRLCRASEPVFKA
jgi:hypothetical protein